MKNQTEAEKKLKNVATRETAESTTRKKKRALPSTQMLIVNIRHWFCRSHLPSQLTDQEQCDGLR
jgi:hypothetical protein